MCIFICRYFDSVIIAHSVLLRLVVCCLLGCCCLFFFVRMTADATTQQPSTVGVWVVPTSSSR